MAETILFPGFPGFIGMRLLPRILELKPHTRIECLVQEKFLGAARQAVATLEGKHGHAPDEPSVSGGSAFTHY